MPLTIAVENEAVTPTLSPAGWTQEAGQLNLLFGRMKATGCDEKPHTVTLKFFLDGQQLGRDVVQLTVPAGGVRTFDFGFEVVQAGVPWTHASFALDSDTPHTVSVEARAGCVGTVINEASIDVVGIT